ncbi:dityrosine transporter A [Mytilinidion resinicola]|uniref:Dityrosine transporter A n=1 Tax=Mytilinidion resinicola TaxID=574789 RepID=A0A6A6YX07_9PEZI|nr:dityrosine transporter A [Mytilinidion resinicola]KAF2812437.1 dityrosine transporter A [Mytilinidion resinicola]
MATPSSVPLQPIYPLQKVPTITIGHEPSSPGYHGHYSNYSSPPYTAFSDGRRKFLLAIITAAAFLAPVAGNIYLPALPQLSVDFRVSRVAINATVSIFMLVFAIAPLFWGACADFMGRKPLYTISFLIFVLANAILIFIPANYGALFFLRILQATGASSVASLGAGTIADMYEPKIRAGAISIFMLGPQLGPVLGPVIGGAIIGGTSWRWIFGFLAILGAAIWVWMLFCLPETLRAKVGNSAIHADKPWVAFPNFHARAPIKPGTIIMKRPSAMNVFKLLKYPPIVLVSVNVAILFGSYYCVAVTLPTRLRYEYHFSETAIGVAYIPIGVSMIAGSLLSGRYSDWDHTRAQRASPDGKVAPENRIKSQLFGVVLFPVGIELYGWSCYFAFHPAVVLTATAVVGFSMSWVFATNTTYMTLAKPGQAATLVAIASLFRNPAASLASLVIDPIVTKIDMSCILIVIVLIWYGPGWRKNIEDEMAAEKAKAAPSMGAGAVGVSAVSLAPSTMQR